MKVLGMRVLRGPDWDQNEADGGEGHLGTVVGVKAKVGTVEVVWDNGQVTKCRVGKEGKHDLRVYDSAPAGACASGSVECEGCRNFSIYGTSWRCSTCSNLDLCSRCYHLGVHPLSHIFLRRDSHTQQGVDVGTRSGASKIFVFGIFPEARVARGRDWQYGDVDGGQDGRGVVVEVVSPDSGSARNAVRVSWNSGQSLQHRLGLHGKVDLVCIEEAPGPACYLAHLPVLSTRPPVRTPKPPEASRPKVPQAAPRCTERKTEGDSKEEIRNDAEEDETHHEGPVRSANEVQLDKGEVTSDGTGKLNKGTVPKGHEVTLDKACVAAKEGIGIEPPGLRSRPEAKADVPVDGLTPQRGQDAEGEIRVGDRVEVGVDFDTFRDIQSQAASWTENMARCLGRTGVVKSVTASGEMEVDFEGDTCKINPISLIKETKSASPVFKEGDTVRIISDIRLLEKQQKDHGGWNSEMAQAAGKVGKVKKVTSRGDLEVALGEHCWVFNPVNCRPAPGCPLDFTHTEDTDSLLQAFLSQGSSKVKKFIDAAREGNNKKLSDMLDEDQSLVHKDRHGATALHHASNEGHTEAVRLLVAKGATVNSGLRRGDTPLMLAVHRHHTDTARVLIELGAEVNCSNQSRMTPLHVAVSVQNVEGVRLLLHHKASVNSQDSKSNTPLYIALTENFDMAIIEALMGASDLDFRVRNKQRATYLHMAVYRDKTRVVETILARDPAVLDYGMDDGLTALQLAAQENHVDMTRLLIRAGANVNTRDERGQAPLHSACFADHIDCARVLVENGADTNATSDDLYTPLHFCLGPRSRRTKVYHTDKGLELAKYLIQHGARTDALNSHGLTPLDLASPAVRRAVEQFLCLADSGPQKNMNADDRNSPRPAVAEINKNTHLQETLSPSNATNAKQAAELNPAPDLRKNTEANTSEKAPTSDRDGARVIKLFYAVDSGDIRKVRAILDKHPDLVRETHEGQTALHYAAMQGQTEAVRLLVAKGADINKGDNDDDTPLVRSILRRRTETATALMELGSDVNYINAKVMTPLHVAVTRVCCDLVQLLLQHRASVNLRDHQGRTSLVLALCMEPGSSAVVEALLEARDLDLRVTTNQDANALHMAVHRNKTGVIEKILTMDPGLVNVPMEIQKSPLHVAAAGSDPAILEMLFRAGAIVNARDQTGRTPLHVACPGDHIENARILLERGADVNARSEDGNTPLHFCVAYTNRSDRCRNDKGLELAKYLIQQGARTDLYNNRGQTVLDAAQPVVREGLEKFLKDRGSHASPKNGNTDEVNNDSPPVQATVPSTKCVTCYLRDADVIFLPCAHKLVCSQCAGSANSCRECGTVIKGKIDMEGNPVGQTSGPLKAPATEEPEHVERQNCKVQ